MTERWSRRDQCSFSSAAPDSEESPEPAGTVGAEGSSTAARARSSRERPGVVDGRLDADVDHRLAGEAVAPLDGQVVGKDDRVGALDEGGVEPVDLPRSLPLDPHRDPALLAGLLEGLGGHEGVGDTGRARGNADDDGPALGGRGGVVGDGGLGGRLLAVGGVGLDLLGDEAGDLLLRGGLAQGVGELGVHQAARELGQKLEVDVVGPGGSGDHEDQVRRLLVGGAEIDRLGQSGEAEGRRQHMRAAAVRDGDAAGDAGRGGLLAGDGVAGQALGGVGAPRRGDDLGQVLDDVLLAGAGKGVEPHEFGDDQWCGRLGGRCVRGHDATSLSDGCWGRMARQRIWVGAPAQGRDAGWSGTSAQTSRVTTGPWAGRSLGDGKVVPGSEAAAEP